MKKFLQSLLGIAILVAAGLWLYDLLVPGPSNAQVARAVQEIYGKGAKAEILERKPVPTWIDPASSSWAKDYSVVVDIVLKVTLEDGTLKNTTFMFMKHRESRRWGYTPMDQGGFRALKDD